MKSYDEIEKAYADMVADSKISDRLRTLLKEKRARMEQVQKEQIYGYKVNDKNLLVVDDLPAENVKFIFYKIEEYIQNPPAELVTEVMERHKGWNTELTYEEAIPLVSLSAIHEYVAEELSVKNMAFILSECPQSAENLRAILARPFADFPADDIRRAYRDKVQAENSNSLLDWKKRVRRVSRNSIYTGTITLERRLGSPSLQKQCALERVELFDHQALVSKEQFEQVNRILKEAKREKTHMEI